MALSLWQVRARMGEISPSLTHVDELTGCPLSVRTAGPAGRVPGQALSLEQAKGNSSSAELELSPFERGMSNNFYATNSIARASVTMAKCISQKGPKSAFIKA